MRKGESIKINGREYINNGLVGQGGAGQVYKCIGPDKSECAVKICKLENKKRAERAKNELEYVSVSHHESIVVINEYELVDDGNESYAICSMPLYGGSLREAIKDGHLSTDTKLKILLEVYCAVEQAHRDGVVHRDIKPENILLDSDNHAILSDFGIAHFPDSSVTTKSELLANRNYCAPEQQKCSRHPAFSEKSDVFALGLLTNEMFTGVVPRGSNIEKVAKSNSFLVELDELIERMIDQDPEARPSASAAKAWLLSIRDDSTEGDFISRQLASKVPGANPSDQLVRMAAEELVSADRILRLTPHVQVLYLSCSKNETVHFSADFQLLNMQLLFKIKEKCENKFRFDSYRFAEKSIPPFFSEEELARDFSVLDEVIGSCLQGIDLDWVHDTAALTRRIFAACFPDRRREILCSLDGMREREAVHLSNTSVRGILQNMSKGLYEELRDHKDFNLKEHLVFNHARSSVPGINDKRPDAIASFYDPEAIMEMKSDLTRLCSVWGSCTYIYDDGLNIKLRFTSKDEFNGFRAIIEREIARKGSGSEDLKEMLAATAERSSVVTFPVCGLIGLKALLLSGVAEEQK